MTTVRFTPAGRRSAPCALSRTRLNTAPPASAFGSGARGTNPFACITSGGFFASLKTTARHAPPPRRWGPLRAARGRCVDAPCPAAKQSWRRDWRPRMTTGLWAAQRRKWPQQAASPASRHRPPCSEVPERWGARIRWAAVWTTLPRCTHRIGESAAPHCKAGQDAPLFFQKWLKPGA